MFMVSKTTKYIFFKTIYFSSKISKIFRSSSKHGLKKLIFAN